MIEHWLEIAVCAMAVMLWWFIRREFDRTRDEIKREVQPLRKDVDRVAGMHVGLDRRLLILELQQPRAGELREADNEFLLLHGKAK